MLNGSLTNKYFGFHSGHLADQSVTYTFLPHPLSFVIIILPINVLKKGGLKNPSVVHTVSWFAHKLNLDKLICIFQRNRPNTAPVSFLNGTSNQAQEIRLCKFNSHLQSYILGKNRLSGNVGERCIKVAENSFQYFPRLRVWRGIITTLYRLMPQSWHQQTAQSLVNKLLLILWHNRLP